MSDIDNRPSLGFGAVALVYLMFPILKLCGLLDWSWWLITAPLWVSIILIALLVMVIGVLALYLMFKFFFDDYEQEDNS